MTNERRGKPPRAAARPRASGQSQPPRIRWGGFRPFYDYWGQEIRRFFQLDTLANATEYMLARQRDRFIVPSVQSVLGPPPIASLAFDLFQEGRHQLIFRLQAANIKRRSASFGFVVAKNAEEHSKVARREHMNLQELYERAPQFVVRSFRGGTVYLPDRHGRAEHAREVYCYLTEWLPTYHELGVNRNMQFFLNTLRPHTLTLEQTEFLKGQIVEILARSFVPKTGSAMAMPEIASGDFVCTHPSKGPLRLKLIACRRLLTRQTPVKYLHSILNTEWDWGGRPFRITPGLPETFFAGLTRALGKDAARAWLAQYVRAIHSGTYRNDAPEYIEALAVLAAEGWKTPCPE